MFLDADDDVDEGFIYTRWQTAIKAQADVVICNAWRTGPGSDRVAVHTRQPYGQCLPGLDWIQHCVARREWPHYLSVAADRQVILRQRPPVAFSDREKP